MKSDQSSGFLKSPLLGLSLATSFLLVLCFPNQDLGFLAWVAWVPFLWAADQVGNRKQALFFGGVTGVIFFGLSMHWLTHVSAVGWIFVAFIEAGFFGVFAVCVFEVLRIRLWILRIFYLAVFWTVIELLRSEFPIFGLGWNLLAYSQTQYPVFLQSANTVGAYGLGFIIFLVNASFFELTRIWAVKKLVPSKNEKILSRIPGLSRGRAVQITGMLFLIFGLMITHGLYHLKKQNPVNGTVRISVLQGNIPQQLKWNPDMKEKIIDIYSKLTELVSYEKPDLIVWPEAAFPGFFEWDEDRQTVTDLLKKIEIPALIGSPHYQNERRIFNSAFYIDQRGVTLNRYDKQYLVPFGEYVPLRLIFGILEPLAYSLGVGDFSPGKEPTVFRNFQIPFSVLICFEDVFPHLARRFVANGAEFLIVITNDAWFGETSAPHQHLQASIFRAVENGIPVIRAANTGISGFISAKGEVLGRVEDSRHQDIFRMGHKTMNITLENKPTLYRLFGWGFAHSLFLFVIIFFGWIRKKNEGLL